LPAVNLSRFSIPSGHIRQRVPRPERFGTCTVGGVFSNRHLTPLWLPRHSPADDYGIDVNLIQWRGVAKPNVPNGANPPNVTMMSRRARILGELSVQEGGSTPSSSIRCPTIRVSKR